ncbi:MAG: hypothetical protein KDB61_16650, partial [Planctomycetes bacterium]|nr:hypothetical protein [Planctomycetota bacterium]
GLSGFTAEQPSGFEGPPLLEIGSIQVGVDLLSTLTDTVKVKDISLDGLHLRLVQNGKESNFMQVYENLRKLSSGGDAAGDSPSETQGAGKNLELGMVHVSGVGATFDLTGIPGIGKSFSYELPAFELDLSPQANENRIQTVEQATARVVERLIEATVAHAKSEVSPELALLIGGDVSGLQERVRSEVEKLKGQAEAKVQALKDQAEG